MRRLLPAVVVLAFTSAPLAGQAGPEQTDRFVKAVDRTMRGMSESQQQLQKALTTYNAIIEQTAKDTRDAYKDLGKDVEHGEKRVAEFRRNVEEMDAEANRLFTSWKASLAAITDRGLRRRAAARLAETRGRYRSVIEAGQATRGDLAAFMTPLKNQVAYLGHDLNPSGVASLKADAVKLNQRARTLFDKIAGATKLYGDYIASLSPQPTDNK